MTAARWAYEDFEIGQVIDLGSRQVTAAEIIEFASEFDPQPMHLDEEAGRASILGGLSASGWHSCSIFMRLFCDGLLLDSTSEGGSGLDYVRWKRPVLAGDTLAARCTIMDKRLSSKRPRLGRVSIRSEMTNQNGEVVLELQNTGLFLKREAA